MFALFFKRQFLKNWIANHTTVPYCNGYQKTLFFNSKIFYVESFQTLSYLVTVQHCTVPCGKTKLRRKFVSTELKKNSFNEFLKKMKNLNRHEKQLKNNVAEFLHIVQNLQSYDIIRNSFVCVCVCVSMYEKSLSHSLAFDSKNHALTIFHCRLIFFGKLFFLKI